MRQLAALIGLLLGVAPSAHAHAFLDHANPRVGSTVAEAPPELSLWYTQNVELAFSTVEVRDESGARVDRGAPRLDPADASLLRVALKPLPAGIYEVRWHVLSVDTHTTDGRFRFTVGK